jgi:hypothetical protein
MKHLASTPRVGLLVADEAWIATALLHREHPERQDFSIQEIVERASAEDISGPLRTGVEKHIQYHCVADRKPLPAQLRMLSETVGGCIGRATRLTRIARGRLFPNLTPSRNGTATCSTGIAMSMRRRETHGCGGFSR